MKAIGLVFLYDRNEGFPQDVSANFISHFSNVTENLVLEGLIKLHEIKEILDMKRVYWGGIKQNFLEMQNDDTLIGKVAWKVYADNSGIESSEEVKSLIYEEKDAPWKFTLMVCVLYD
ncbi:MAG: hypothetical protein ACTSPN_09720 [Promethearchaeota archaeon]